MRAVAAHGPRMPMPDGKWPRRAASDSESDAFEGVAADQWQRTVTGDDRDVFA